jgi:hypothetical protein
LQVFGSIWRDTARYYAMEEHLQTISGEHAFPCVVLAKACFLRETTLANRENERERESEREERETVERHMRDIDIDSAREGERESMREGER